MSVEGRLERDGWVNKCWRDLLDMKSPGKKGRNDDVTTVVAKDRQTALGTPEGSVHKKKEKSKTYQ